MNLIVNQTSFSLKSCITILITLLVFSASTNAQKLSIFQIVNKATQKVTYGYKDDKGKIVVPAKYDEIEGLPYQNKALVYLGDYNYILDIKKGTLLKVDYPILHSFNEYGLFPIGNKPIDGKSGYMNSEGKIVIEPKYNFLGDGEEYGGFQQGLLCAKLNDKYGFIDPTGKVVKDFIYSRAEPFINGKAKVKEDRKPVYYLDLQEVLNSSK